ncbi:MAG: hypothetical protein AABY22_03960, partial [Nanoarchaeota archaeon]
SPKIIKISPKIVELNPDGTYTFWQYSIWGAVGQSGTLKVGVETEELTTKRDFEALERLKNLLDMAVKSSENMFNMMKAHDELFYEIAK